MSTILNELEEWLELQIERINDEIDVDGDFASLSAKEEAFQEVLEKIYELRD